MIIVVSRSIEQQGLLLVAVKMDPEPKADLFCPQLLIVFTVSVKPNRESPDSTVGIPSLTRFPFIPTESEFSNSSQRTLSKIEYSRSRKPSRV